MFDYICNDVIVDDKGTIENIYSKKISVSVNKSKNTKLGVMLVGLGGNNGSTFTAGILAYQKKIEWDNKNGRHNIDFYGSLHQYGHVHIGYDKHNKPYSKLIKELVEMRDLQDIVIGGWDICEDNLYKSCEKNKVIEPTLLHQLPELKDIVPLKSIYYESFIASNQKIRVNNIKNNDENSKWNDVINIMNDIEQFKKQNNVDDVVVVWTASTERFHKGEWLNAKMLLDAIKSNDKEISPSMIFAVASIMSKCIFINGSPQNTLIPSVIELASEYKTFVGGEDFKTGQTKIKSVLADFIASSGIKPLSIVSYNHLGNNDGLNLDESEQFKSKEITKKNVIDDIIDENPELFKDSKPDHCVVIKYIPSVGDSKRAMDEYYNKLFLDGRQTFAIHNTCEDSLLAVPLILDIILFAEFFSRVKIKIQDEEEKPFSSCLSLLSFFFKAPIVNDEPLINAFFKQKYSLENFIRLCAGLPPLDFMNLYKRI